MKSFFPLLIILSVIALSVSTYRARDQAPCCGNNSISLKKNHFSECENGQKPELSCRQGFAKVTHAFDLVFYGEDEEGKFMTALAKDYSFTVREPYYCTANQTVDGKNTITALYCIDGSQRMTRETREYLRNLFFMIVALLFLASGLLLAITAVIYFILPQTQNIEEKCTFHITLNQSMFCLLSSFYTLSVNTNLSDELREHCAIYWYLLLFTSVSFYTWSDLLAYHMWSRFGQNSGLNESKVMNRYLLIGYGIPALLVVLSNIHIHWRSFSETHNFYEGCYLHSSSEYTLIYAGLPIIVIQSACVYFFVSLHRKLWNEQSENSPQHSTFNVKKYKFRLVLNAKLLLLMGLPFWLLIICFALLITLRIDLFVYIIAGTYCFVSAEGIIIFFMLVIRRKRIVRGLAEKFGFSASWQPCPEEEPIEHGYENENQLSQEL